MTWAKSLGDSSARIVRRDEIGDVVVSTVWLGLDHNFGGKGPPLIFETMVFGGTNSEYQERYSTEAAAIAGHERIAAAVKEGRIIGGERE
jgi:hypothetical protein